MCNGAPFTVEKISPRADKMDIYLRVNSFTLQSSVCVCVCVCVCERERERERGGDGGAVF